MSLRTRCRGPRTKSEKRPGKIITRIPRSLLEPDATHIRPDCALAMAMVSDADLKQSSLSSLETLSRDEKTAGRTLAQLKDKLDHLTQKRDKLAEEESSQSQKKTEMISELSAELKHVKQECDNQLSERARIEQLEKVINEKLVDIYEKLTQAGVSQRETRLKETLANLQRISVSPVAIDAIVVDEEKTAIDCIEYMPNQRAGQAKFVPLDTIQVKPINDKFRSFAKGAQLAVDVIHYDPAVERAMHHACGNALVCDSMEVARDHLVQGQRHNVTWDTSNAPVNITNKQGTILLRKGDSTTPVILETGFDILLGRIEVTVRWVISDTDYSVVRTYSPNIDRWIYALNAPAPPLSVFQIPARTNGCYSHHAPRLVFTNVHGLATPAFGIHCSVSELFKLDTTRAAVGQYAFESAPSPPCNAHSGVNGRD
ncbi:hypothetical protein NUW54_g1651 [Trametes sanguinea]|uniref:Uncharacterized protein n=1 Tax=Trametes sanguinea TaxID=158606 RepID=A0ACC1Q8P4_9APHY|nr:hypothetical protein NUW54_g1651 [Trametes sanguinea]